MGKDQEELSDIPKRETVETITSTVSPAPIGPISSRENAPDASPLLKAFPALDKSLLGSTFADKYKILEPLGQGGMSIVYRAKHLTMNRDVVIKILHSNRTSDEISCR